MATAGIAVSRDTIWRFLREGLSFKKSLFALEQARTAVARKRACWQALKRQLDPDRLVFVDETWIKTNMAPLRGWAKKGKRLKGYAPHGHWRTMTFLAGLRTDGLSAPCVLTYAMQRFQPADYLASQKARSDRRFGAPAPDCGSCRPIHRTSTPSSRPSPRSSTGCATPKNETSTTHAVISDASSTPSSPASARTTSKTPDMVPTKTDALQSAADDLRDLLIA